MGRGECTFLLNSCRLCFMSHNPEGSWLFTKKNPLPVWFLEMTRVQPQGWRWGGACGPSGVFLLTACFSVFLSQPLAGPSSPVTLALCSKEGWPTCITFSNTRKSPTTTHPSRWTATSAPWSPSMGSPCSPRYGPGPEHSGIFFSEWIKGINDHFLLELWADFSSLRYLRLQDRGLSCVCDFLWPW